MRACTLVLPFLRETSDVKFAFVTGGKDPDEILKNSGKEAMQKIIDNALPLVDFLWEIVNKNYLVNTPGGRTSAEKYLKDCISKINDKIFQNEINEEYNNRKFNQWHKWKKQEYQQDIEIPDVDIMTQNIIKSIVQKYPEISEKYIDFLLSLNLSFDEDVKNTELNIKEAENYIKSFKLQIEIKKLEKKKKELLSNALNGENYDKELLEKINTELKDYNNKLELLLDSK